MGRSQKVRNILMKKINYINDYLKELDIDKFNYQKIAGGVNSQIYKIWNHKKIMVLKLYPDKDFLNRDRIKSEYDFLTLLNKCGYNNVPKPIKWSFENNWMIMSFLDGKHIKNIENIHYEKLLKFIIELQRIKENSFAKVINNASEASFRIIDHYRSIKKRLKIYEEKTDNIDYLKSKDKKKFRTNF